MHKKPIIEQRTTNIPISLPAILFGIFWNLFLVFTVLNIKELNNPIPTIIFISIFFLIGFYIIYYGLSSKKSEILEITSKEVCFNRTNWRGKKSGWVEQISNYRGLMVNPRRLTIRKDHDITVYDIDLIHKEKKPNVTLRTFYDITKTRTPIEKFAKQLELSVLEEDINGLLIERIFEELDDKLPDRFLKGKFKRSFASEQPYKSKKYQLIETSEGLILRRSYYGVLTIGISMVSIAIYLIFGGFLSLGFNFALFVCGGFMIIGGLAKENLEVKNEMIYYRTLIFNKEFSSKTINLSDIEDISIRNNPAYGNVKSLNQAIRISSDKTEIFFAQYTPKEERKWIADKLIELTIRQG